MPDGLPEVWDQIGDGADCRLAREAIARSLGFCRCRCLRSAIDRRDARDLRASRHQAPERYGLPANPVIPPSYTYWKWLAKPIGLVHGALGHRRCLLPPRFLRTKITCSPSRRKSGLAHRKKSKPAERRSRELDRKNFDEKARGEFARHYACSSWRVVASSGLHAVSCTGRLRSSLSCLCLPGLRFTHRGSFTGSRRCLAVDHARGGFIHGLGCCSSFLFFSSSIGLRRWHGPQATGVG